MSQESLFELDVVPSRVSRPSRATTRSSHGQDIDADKVADLALRLRSTTDHVERASLAAEFRELGESLFEANLRAANRQGLSWREIGRRVGVPFQTLHRRYG